MLGLWDSPKCFDLRCVDCMFMVPPLSFNWGPVWHRIHRQVGTSRLISRRRGNFLAFCQYLGRFLSNSANVRGLQVIRYLIIRVSFFLRIVLILAIVIIPSVHTRVNHWLLRLRQPNRGSRSELDNRYSD